jgi:hypothetical protein
MTADLRTGKGILAMPDAEYVGNFLDGQMTGEGHVLWNDGFEYIGDFNKGIVSGFGRQIYSDGEIHTGYFIDGLPVEMGIHEYADGLVYHGGFDQAQMDYDEVMMYYRQSDQTEFMTITNQVIEDVIEEDMSINEKIKAVHDYLILNVVYDDDGYECGDIPHVSHTAYGALVNGVAVCDGYASAFNHLLNRIGVDSDMVMGTADGENHAWNLVRFEEGQFFVDVTWDDGGNHVRTEYYKLTDEQMQRDHSIELIIE